MNISVCIPCIQKHITFLPRCLQSIAKQSLLPYEVIITLSNIEDPNNIINTVEFMLCEFKQKLNLRIDYTTQKRYAGENRNRAVSLANGNIISFIDADDVMQKNRIQILYSIFGKYQCVGVLHHFLENVVEDTIEHFDEKHVKKYFFNESLHFGHGTFSKNLFTEFQYSSLPRGQDVRFVADILDKYIDQLYIYERPLSFYISNDSTFWGSAKL